MILLITASTRAAQCAQALHEATSRPVEVATTLRQAISQLRNGDYTAAVIDQLLLEADPDESEVLLQQLGTAVRVHENFAICGIERLVRELRLALHRREQDEQLARRGAEQALRSELKGTVTALLLSSEMALKVPNLPPAVESKLQTVDELAREIRAKLGGNG